MEFNSFLFKSHKYFKKFRLYGKMILGGMMRIGVDIDNVISNFNEVLLEEFLIHDKELKNNGIINPNADYITKGMFDWKQEEVDNFYINNIERIAKKLNVIDGAKEYIDRLKQDGHQIYIITGRDNGEYSNPYNMTKEWLSKFNIYYDKLILTNAYKNDKHGKTEKCLENDIDIMIRKGAYSNTQYHIKETYKLKEYFDNLLGYNLYDLFPKIKDNL